MDRKFPDEFMQIAQDDLNLCISHMIVDEAMTVDEAILLINEKNNK